jgi:branched-chain amino acid transport system substrate-binding protein
MFLIGMLFSFNPSGFSEQSSQISIPKEKPVLIGLGSPLSGEYAKLGIDMKQGIRIALRKKPFLFDHKIELIHLDDQCDLDRIPALAGQFTGNPLVTGVIGYMCTAETLKALKAHEEAALPLISATSSNFSLTAKASPIVFRINVNELIQARGIALYARKKKWRRAMIVHGPSPYSQALSEAFKDAFLTRGKNRLALESFPPEGAGIEPLIKAVKKNRPHFILFFASPQKVKDVLRIKDAKALKWTAIFLDQRFLDEKDSLGLAQNNIEGLYMTSADLLKGGHQDEWLQAYRKSYGEQGIYTIQAHDASSILIRALRTVASGQENGNILIDKGKLQKAIRKIDFKGVSGPIRFDEKGDRTTGKVTIHRIHKGNLKVVKEIAVE